MSIAASILKAYSQILSTMQKVPGVILIVTCRKYLSERVPNYIPNADSYEGWPIIYCLAEPNLTSDYVVTTPGGRMGKKSFLIVKCEDTYVHLLKKFDLAVRALETMYDIEQGILKIGDDIVINENLLKEFLNTETKADYIGRTYSGNEFNVDEAGYTCRESRNDESMFWYFIKNPDAADELKKLTGKYDWPFLAGKVRVPAVPAFPPGMALYFSTKAIKAIHDEMNSIEFKVLDEYDNTGWNYLIEDIAIAYILYKHGISLTNMNNFFENSREFVSNSIFTHTAIQGQYINMQK